MLTPGETFGRYRIEELAAIGGMGAVYRATDTVLERPVALKVLVAAPGDPDRGRRLAQESLHAAGLSHPHIVTVYDAGEVEGTDFVAMRWVEGRTLEDELAASGPLAPERAVTIVGQVAAALEHAHGRGLVHRDVKPDNVMMGRDGTAFLMDFGLGKRVDGADGATRTGEFSGTVDFAAPEQIEGRPVDEAVDVYGLGALAFRCLTGHVPFERDGVAARLFAAVNDPAPAPSSLRPGLPAAVDAVVLAALAKDPADRPVTVRAFGDELRAALAPQAEAAPVVARLPRRRVTARAVLAGVAAVLLAAAGAYTATVVPGDAPEATAGDGDTAESRAALRQGDDPERADGPTRAGQAAGGRDAPAGAAAADGPVPAGTPRGKRAARRERAERRERREGDRDDGRAEAPAFGDRELPPADDDRRGATSATQPSSGAAAAQPPASDAPAPAPSGDPQPAQAEQPASAEPAPATQTTPSEEPPPSDTTTTPPSEGGSTTTPQEPPPDGTTSTGPE